MKTIYIDVLLVLNTYVNFFLLRATARLTHSSLKTRRCIISAALGSLFSLTILLPALGFFMNMVIKLAAAALLTVMAFGRMTLRETARLVLWFYLVNVIFGGIVMALYTLFRPGFMAFYNSSLYIDFSLLSLIVFTAVAYLAVTLVRYRFDKGAEVSGKYVITIRNGGNVCRLSALADTGNSLVDVFTGKPVIVCQHSLIAEIIDISLPLVPENAAVLTEESDIRFIPYSTISGSGLLPVFTPDEAVISDEEHGFFRKIDVMIGISDKDIPAVFNPGILC